MTLNDFIVFIYESGICLAVLFAMYWLFLRKETYFRFNRFYLLSIILVAFALPLTNLGVFENSSEVSPLKSISGLSEAINIPAVTITHGSESLSTSSYNWRGIALVIYLLGASLLFARVILGIIRVEMLRRKGRQIVLDAYSIIYTKQEIAPFSFFRTIYLNDKLDGEPDSTYIINHEVIHIKQLHTYDNLFVELFLAIFWFNPFMWLLKGALRENHEYLADNGVLNQKANPTTYQTLLLKQTIGLAPITLTSTFNSTIKNRIIMMCKNKSSVFAKFKPLLLVPIIATLFLIFTCNEKTKAQTTVKSQTTSAQEEQNTVPQVMPENGVRTEIDPESGETYYVIEEMPTYKGDIPATADVLPDVEPIEEPDVEPIAEPDVDPIAEPDVDPIAEPDVDPIAEPDDVLQDTVRVDREIFWVVEEMPTFNGGDPAVEFRKFIAQNLEYPESASKDSISGRVIVQFVINKEGKLVEPVIVRSASPALDKEGIRVVSESPLWKPGKQRGKEVEVLFTFPINFVLQ